MDDVLQRALLGDKRAIEALIVRTVKQLAHLWTNYTLAVRDDIKQEIAIACLRALRDYDPARGSFAHYAAVWSRSRISLFMDKNRLLSGRRQRQLDQVVSLDYQQDAEDDLHDRIADVTAERPDHRLEVQELLEQHEQRKPKPRRWVALNIELVQEIRRLRADGLTIAQVSERLGISKTNVWFVSTNRIWPER